jgi:hypothetical protein
MKKYDNWKQQTPNTELENTCDFCGEPCEKRFCNNNCHKAYNQDMYDDD